ncbi:MAG: GNAT family N-acetyltransferase [Clostridiales bacterium]|nr:GNAT family N-acetyltransferase [Clostridiales bacterium]
MVIEELKKEEAALAAPLAAQFRVKLRSFKGIISEPDIPAGEEELNEYLGMGYPVYVAREEGKPVGYAVLRVDGYCVWVESLFVLEEYRRRGIASALFDRAEEYAASIGEDTVYNYIHPNNEAVIAFLRSKGYSVLNLIEVRKPYAGEKIEGKVRVGENEFDY